MASFAKAKEIEPFREGFPQGLVWEEPPAIRIRGSYFDE